MSQYFSNIYDVVKTMISGMSLTLEHLRKKKDLVATLQYPNEKWPQPERSIGFEHKDYNVIRSRLHVDIDDCIGCLQCERACPVDCIKIDTIKPARGVDFDCGETSNDTRKKMIVPRFTIDMSECMYCNLCVYPCPEECIYMVGGPNEPKHDIDYEYSKYVKHDLVFEFSNVTDQQIVDIGAQSYLDERNSKINKITDGNNLDGNKLDIPIPAAAAPTVAAPVAAAQAAPVQASDTLDIKCLEIIEDKKLKTPAKKVFFKSKRAGEDDIVKIDKVIAEINKLDGYTPELEQKLNSLKPAAAPAVAAPVAAAQAAPVQASDTLDIKCLEIIEDKKLKTPAKKVFFKSKRAGEDDIVKIDKVIAEINKLDGYTPELEQKLKDLL